MSNKELELNPETINEENEMYTLAPWGCLSIILNDYNIDISHIKGKVGIHIVEDFMELMEKMGYIKKVRNE